MIMCPTEKRPAPKEKRNIVSNNVTVQLLSHFFHGSSEPRLPMSMLSLVWSLPPAFWPTDRKLGPPWKPCVAPSCTEETGWPTADATSSVIATATRIWHVIAELLVATLSNGN